MPVPTRFLATWLPSVVQPSWGHPSCWSGSGFYTEALCCTGRVPQCWDAVYTFDFCCTSRMCKVAFATNDVHFQRASSHIFDSSAGPLVEARAGDANVCTALGGQLHVVEASHVSIATNVKKVILNAAACMPQACSSLGDKTWIARQLFGKSDFWTANIPQVQLHVDFRAFGNPAAGVMSLFRFGTAGFLGGSLLTWTALLVAATFLDLASRGQTSLIQAISIRRSLQRLIAQPSDGYLCGLDIARVVLTMIVVTCHVATLTDWRGEFPSFWLHDCSAPQPWWHCLASKTVLWTNAGFVVLSSFLLGRATPRRGVLTSARWHFRRSLHLYFRVVPQQIFVYALLTWVLAEMPAHHKVAKSGAFVKILGDRKRWCADSFLLGQACEFVGRCTKDGNAGIFEVQLGLLLFVLMPMGVAIALPWPIGTAAASAWAAIAWTAAVPPDGRLRAPRTLVPFAIVGFVIGLLVPRDRRLCQNKLVLFAAAGGCLGIAALPIAERLHANSWVLGRAFLSFTRFWPFAPALTFSLGFGLTLVALDEALGVTADDPTGVRRAVAVLARLSLGVLVNNNRVIQIVLSGGLQHEPLPCSTYMFFVWAASTLLLTASVAVIQWCILEAPASALMRLASL
eukprot:TRINITY_DN27448_c0_g2_i1.p1 TRINITY_DN27448_c0_g2~~TRINITY_DN27448_c0_g2_i1.p1  ORF type:complete len:654 (+),score=72.11 TRINITY_DN27448_c0_g2_i1:87-1964(+)